MIRLLQETKQILLDYVSNHNQLREEMKYTSKYKLTEEIDVCASEVNYFEL